MSFYVAEKCGEPLKVVEFKLSRGIEPKLPNYVFSKPFDTKSKAEAHKNDINLKRLGRFL